jgi:uncharacterized protein HemY
MEEASVMGFLRTILILILVYYVLKWLGRILFPVLFQKAVRNFESKMRQEQSQTQASDQVKEGETVIDRKPGPQRESNKNVGEYVDYEEID